MRAWAGELKLRQREDALARGIPLIEWTFDPLELKNAFFNIERLGAIVRRYAVNQYGITGSPLHGGLPTDRCYAEWWVGSPRVRAILAGERPEFQVAERIAFPADIARIRAEDNHLARAHPARQRGEVSGCISHAAWPSPASRVMRPKAPICWSHGMKIDRVILAPDPHAAGALLRDQLRPHLPSATSFWWKRRARALPAGAKSRRARIRSTTKSGPTRPG